MKKRISVLALLFFLALAACASPEKSSSTSPAPAVSEGEVSATATRQPGCTLKSRQATPDPTLEALLPPPGDDDWIQGPSDAYVTIIEYSDFQ